MKLVDYKVNEFIDILASDAPAPGGGSASALAGAVGISLTAMVSSLTIGKEKYKEHEAVIKDVLQKAIELKSSLLKAIDDDNDAYNKVTDVFKLPKETQEDKDARKEAMQSALKLAIKPPFEMMEYACEALLVTREAVGKSNVNAASDLGVSSLNLKSCIQGAWLNVLINLGSIKDEDFKNEYIKKGNDLLIKSLPVADEIYKIILDSLSM